MSIVTSVLDKLRLFGAMPAWIAALVPKLTLDPSRISLSSFGRGREWSSVTRAEEFQRKELVRRAFNEMQGRLPVAR